ncbi:MAG: ABC transporter substrate-binding protein [Propionibacteriaceae bacterium]|jgi:raffinose/stachyose/melibiose transport system substrate-binding protein|nr:ABC transporter substrate-binding protein [Propionibacteriaceae bacterium]
MPPPRPPRRVPALAAAAALALALTACGPTDGRVQIDFFQFKSEAQDDFAYLVEKFEQENPDIDVVYNVMPDPDTAIRTLLVKGRTPDVITLNGSGTFAQLARTGVFYDFTGDPLLAEINPAPLAIVNNLGTYHGDEINSLPYLSNADGIIYNRTIFAEQGLAIPTTWDELIAVCDALQSAGITPFYGTLADAWTALPSLNALGSYATATGFLDRLKEAGADAADHPQDSFTANFGQALDRQAQLFAYANPDYRARTYDDGNLAFANGETAMLLQGIWALSQIRAHNPDIDAGIFPYPADTPEEAVIVSGVDVTVTMARDTDHPDEARRFIEFLFRSDNIEWIAERQAMFSARADTPGSSDPALAEIQPLIDAGRVAPFLDHQVPAAVPLQQIDQQYLFDLDRATALAALDREWNKVARRTTR